jgi:hypothetical protein
VAAAGGEGERGIVPSAPNNTTSVKPASRVRQPDAIMLVAGPLRAISLPMSTTPSSPSTRSFAVITGASSGTEFFERADMLDTKVGAGEQDDPADVAREGFDAMMRGEERVVAGSLTTKIQGKAGRILPDSVKAGMHRRMAEPGSAKH